MSEQHKQVLDVIDGYNLDSARYERDYWENMMNSAKSQSKFWKRKLEQLDH